MALPSAQCEYQSLHPTFLLPTAELSLKRRYLPRGVLAPNRSSCQHSYLSESPSPCMSPDTDPGEFLHLLPSSPSITTTRSGAQRGTCIQASHCQRMGKEAQSWEEAAGKDFLRQRIQSPAVRGKHHGNLNCSLRTLGNLGKRENTFTTGKVFSGRNTGTREACSQNHS